MKISEIIQCIESIAPLSLQEDYDNSGLLTGNPEWECSGVLCTLDVTDEVLHEAIARQCNCIVAHHPVIFRGLKKLTGANLVERIIIGAIKADIAIYAAHTNVDNIVTGVNGRIADRLGLKNRQVLSPGQGVLKKLYTFVPADHLEKVREALFSAGAGNISNYTECSFTHEGTGTFKPAPDTNPYSGTIGQRQEEREIKVEVILPAYAERKVIAALLRSHPYEEVAYDLVSLDNVHQGTGSGLVGDIDPIEEKDFMQLLRERFEVAAVRHTAPAGRQIKRVAVCGGAGSFLVSSALSTGADVFVSADFKYHEFFLADGRIMICDIGHYESEQFTTGLFVDILLQKFPTFAVLKSEVNTNPVRYFAGK